MTAVLVGDANVDLILRLPDRAADTKQGAIPPPELHGGGTVANTAVALARLGVPVALISAAGDDGYGRWVRDDLVREGVDTTGLRLVPEDFTPTVIAAIHPDGERSIYVWPPTGSAHISLRVDDLDPARIAGADWLHTSGMVLRGSPVREAALHAMLIAHEAGVPVSLDLNLRLEVWGWADEFRATIKRAIRLADVVFGHAAEEIVPLAGVENIEMAAQAISHDRRIVVARHGGRGALVAGSGYSEWVPAFEIPAIVDTLGAGDAFNGGFIAARLAGRDPVECARWGNAVAALKIGQAGARGLPSREAVARLLAGT